MRRVARDRDRALEIRRRPDSGRCAATNARWTLLMLGSSRRASLAFSGAPDAGHRAGISPGERFAVTQMDDSLVVSA